MSLLQQAYKAVADFKEVVFQKRLFYVMFEQFLMKYVWTGAGMFMIAIPIMTGESTGNLTNVSLSTCLSIVLSICLLWC